MRAPHHWIWSSHVVSLLKDREVVLLLTPFLFIHTFPTKFFHLATSELLLSYFFILDLFLCGCGSQHSMAICGGHKTTYKSQFFSSTMQVQGLTSRHPAWQQVLLLLQPSCYPYFLVLCFMTNQYSEECTSMNEMNLPGEFMRIQSLFMVGLPKAWEARNFSQHLK